MKKLLIIIIAVILGLIIFEWAPIRRSISMEEADERLNNDNTYICEHVATTGPSWRVYMKGDMQARLVCLEGDSSFHYLNKQTFFFFSVNKFLIQGEVI